MSSLTTLPTLGDRLTASIDLSGSRAHCRDVVRARAGNFFHGMRLVPEPKRSATYALYAWLREADDLADEDDGADPAEKTRRLERFWDETIGVLDGGQAGGATPARPGAAGTAAMWPAFRDAVATYRLPIATLREHVSGQLLDQRKTRYADFDELYDYCRRVASTVGLMCVDIWGHSGSAAVRQLAEWRGVAFQLTNILRDVREDAALGRVYLPRCPLCPDELLAGGRESLRALGPVIARAREFYERSKPLDAHLHPDGRACLWAMTEIYRGVFELIEWEPARAFGPRRVGLPSWKKAWIAMRAVTA